MGVKRGLMGLVFLLAACGPKSDLSLDCRGAEPFWLGELRGPRFDLQWVGEDVQTRDFDGARVGDVWTGRSTSGESVRLELKAELCHDGMNDQIPATPWRVTITLPDGSEGRGCCAVKD